MRKCFSTMAMAVVFTAVQAGLNQGTSIDEKNPSLSINKSGDSLVDSDALVLGEDKYGPMRFSSSINGNSFQQDAVVTHSNYQYVGYYDSLRHVCIARRKLRGGDWEIIRFRDYIFNKNDAHNVISIGICPNDGTIHMAFDHHGKTLHYRVSEKGVASDPESVKWETSLFSDVLSRLGDLEIPSVTYPRFWQTPDGELQFCWRQGGSGNGDRMLADYDSRAGTWKNIHQIDSRDGAYGDSTSRCSYPNGYTYGPKGFLHTTWVWREEATGKANHDLMYMYSEDRGNTWKTSDGKRLKGIAMLDSPGITVVHIPDTLGLMNTHGQAVDSHGRIHAVVWHCTEESLAAAGSRLGETRWGPPQARRYHHYWRDASGVWQYTEIPGAVGNRPKVFLDAMDNAFLIFGRTGGQEELEEEVYFDEGELVIMSASASSGWRDWRIVHVEKGPFHNEMLYDYYRWQNTGILSVMVQQKPQAGVFESPLRILDFEVIK